MSMHFSSGTLRNVLLYIVLALFPTIFYQPQASASTESDANVLGTMSLIDVIETLRSAGIRLIYSSDLVTPELQVYIDDISLEALSEALPTIGLQIKPLDGEQAWIISEYSRLTTTGRIVTPEGEAIANAQIRALKSGQQLYSNTQGYFSLNPLEREETLSISAQGYRRAILPVHRSREGSGNSSEVDLGTITLIPVGWMENIIITGSRYRFPYENQASSPYSVSSDEMKVVPALGSDSLRIVNRLPGVSSVGVSAKPRIRGGLQDEVLILLDGVELLEPFHLADFHSGYSSIDGQTVESVDIYTGGFPSRYGNRMSGVMEITTDRRIPEYSTEIGLSVFSAFVNNRGEAGEVAGKKVPADWLVSVRGGDLKELTDFMEPRASHPEYADGTAILHLAVSEQAELSFGGIISRDDIGFTDDEESASSDIASHYLWTRLDTNLSDTLQSAWVLSYATSDREKMALTAEEDGKNGFYSYTQKVSRISLRNDYQKTTGKHLLEFGAQLAYGRAQYDYSAEFDRGVLADLLASERFVEKDIHRRPKGWSAGIYAAADLAVTQKLHVQPGLRWDYQNYFQNNKQQLSPRLGLMYEMTTASRVRFSIGRFYQPEGIHELLAIDGVDLFFSPQKSNQAILGLDWQRDQWSFKGEIYYKGYPNPKQRYENLFNPFVLLPEIEPDRVQLNPQKAFAQGLDLEFKYDFSEHLMGLIRYSYMDAQDRINGTWVPRRWSQRNTWNALVTWQKNDFALSAALSWHSGWRSSRLPDSIPIGTQVPLEAALNNTELRNHISLDISASKSWTLGKKTGGKTQLTLYADITNVTERENIAGLDFEAEEDGDRVFFTPEGETLLNLVASAGIIFSF